MTASSRSSRHRRSTTRGAATSRSRAIRCRTQVCWTASYYAGGYCGHGIAMATYLGELIARRMAGEPIEHPLFDDRFPAIPLYRGTPVVSAAGRRLLSGEGLAAVDLEFSADEMRAMADAGRRALRRAHRDARRQPSCGDVDAAALCRAMREPAPEQGAALEPLLDSLFRDWIPRSFTPPVPAISPSFPAAASFRRRSPTSSPTRPIATPASGRRRRRWSSSRPTRSTGCATGWSFRRGDARPVHHRRLDGDVQRHRVRPRTAPRRRDPARRAVHLRSGAPLGAEIGEARRRHAGSRARDRSPTIGYRLRIDALREAIAEDRRAGLTPFAVVSSAGTTNTGAVDPLDAIADMCARRRAVAPHRRRLRRVLLPVRRAARRRSRGLPRADSLTLDPHKGMFLPYGTGALLVRDGAALRAAHEATAAYLPAMPHPQEFYDPSQHGPELSRGFPGLRVWLSVKLFGAAAFRAAHRREARADARRGAPRRGAAGHRDRRRAGAVAVRVPPHLAGRDAGRRGRGDARADGADHRARAGDGDRLHGARPISSAASASSASARIRRRSTRWSRTSPASIDAIRSTS